MFRDNHVLYCFRELASLGIMLLGIFLAGYRDWRCCMGLQPQDEHGLTAAAATKDAFLGGAVLAL